MQQGKKEGYIWTFGFNISMLALRSHHVTCDGFEMVFKGKTFVSTCSSLFFFFPLFIQDACLHHQENLNWQWISTLAFS